MVRYLREGRLLTLSWLRSSWNFTSTRVEKSSARRKFAMLWNEKRVKGRTQDVPIAER